MPPPAEPKPKPPSAFARLKRALLAPIFGKPPNPPASVDVVARSRELRVSWRPGERTSPHNADEYVLEVSSAEPRVPFAEFYRGEACAFVVTRLQPERRFDVRVRCVNRSGASRWRAIENVRTAQVPVGCGGVGPTTRPGETYGWDQTPTTVELRVPAPDGTTPRDLSVVVRTRRLEVSCGGEIVVAGELSGDVLCQDGDYEWELRDAGEGGDGAKEVFVTLEKRVAAENVDEKYRPEAQWASVFAGREHPRVDLLELRWLRDVDYRPPQDARNVEEVAAAMPGMRIDTSRDSTRERGSDGDIGDWGGNWRKSSA